MSSYFQSLQSNNIHTYDYSQTYTHIQLHPTHMHTNTATGNQYTNGYSRPIFTHTTTVNQKYTHMARANPYTHTATANPYTHIQLQPTRIYTGLQSTHIQT